MTLVAKTLIVMGTVVGTLIVLFLLLAVLGALIAQS